MNTAYFPIFNFNQFAGLANKTPSFKLNTKGQSKIFLTKAVNVDIDNNDVIKNRYGLVSVYTGANIHSVKFYNNQVIFIDNGTLRTLSKVIRNNFGNAPVYYTEINNLLYLTNGDFIGYYDGNSLVEFSSVSMEYAPTKIKMPAGRLLTYFNGRLFTTKPYGLIFSDPLDFGVFDAKQNIILFNEEITNILGTSDFLYIGTIKGLYSANKEFNLTKLTNIPCLPNTFVLTHSDFTKVIDYDGDVVLGVCKEGFFMVYNNIFNLINYDTFDLPDTNYSFGTLVNHDNYKQYLFLT